VVYPTPDEDRTLALDFRVRPTWMTLNEHSPALNVEWHEGVKLGARRRAHSAVREFDLAAASDAEYVTFVRRRTNLEAQEDDGRIPMSSVPRSRREFRNRVGNTHGEDF
jgi:hypothetical protein